MTQLTEDIKAFEEEFYKLKKKYLNKSHELNISICDVEICLGIFISKLENNGLMESSD